MFTQEISHFDWLKLYKHYNKKACLSYEVSLTRIYKEKLPKLENHCTFFFIYLNVYVNQRWNVTGYYC